MAVAINAYLPERHPGHGRDAQPRRILTRGSTPKANSIATWFGTAPAMNPLLRQQAWHVPAPLDLAAMRAAANLFVGKHDFKSLAATRNYEMKSTVRTLRRCDIRRHGPLLTFVIEGDGFLYKMCRGIVGTLVQAGQGKIAPAEIKNILRRKDRRAAGHDRPRPRAGLVEGVLLTDECCIA